MILRSARFKTIQFVSDSYCWKWQQGDAIYFEGARLAVYESPQGFHVVVWDTGTAIAPPYESLKAALHHGILMATWRISTGQLQRGMEKAQRLIDAVAGLQEGEWVRVV